MIITCPNCATRYRLSVAQLGATERAARCSACGHAWTVTPIEQTLRETLLSGLADESPGQGAMPPGTPTAGAPPATPVGREQAKAAPGSAGGDGRGEREPAASAEQRSPPSSADPPATEADDGEATTPSPAPASSPPAADGLEAPDSGDGEPPGTADDASVDGANAGADPEAARADDGFDGDKDDNNGEPGPLPSVLAGKEAEKDNGNKGAKRGDESKERARWKLAAAGLAVALPLLAVAAALLGRDAVVTAVPASEQWYALIGLEPALGAGLAIGSVTSAREDSPQGTTLAVEGSVTNTSEVPRPVPMIRVALLDVDNEELQHVLVRPAQPDLDAGGALTFTAQLANPAPTARRIKVTFADTLAGRDDEPAAISTDADHGDG